MNRLEKTLEIYKLLNVKIQGLEKVEFFKPMYKMVSEYDIYGSGMISSAEEFATYNLTDHYKLAKDTEWLIEEEDPFIKITIKRVTTEEIKKYCVYVYKVCGSYRVQKWCEVT